MSSLLMIWIYFGLLTFELRWKQARGNPISLATTPVELTETTPMEWVLDHEYTETAQVENNESELIGTTTTQRNRSYENVEAETAPVMSNLANAAETDLPTNPLENDLLSNHEEPENSNEHAESYNMTTSLYLINTSEETLENESEPNDTTVKNLASEHDPNTCDDSSHTHPGEELVLSEKHIESVTMAPMLPISSIVTEMLEHQSHNIKAQRDDHREWNAEKSVVQLMGQLMRLLKVDTADLNGYQHITALRSPDGSLYVPRQPQQSMHQHLATLLGFADEIMTNENVLIGIHESGKRLAEPTADHHHHHHSSASHETEIGQSNSFTVTSGSTEHSQITPPTTPVIDENDNIPKSTAEGVHMAFTVTQPHSTEEVESKEDVVEATEEVKLEIEISTEPEHVTITAEMENGEETEETKETEQIGETQQGQDMFESLSTFEETDAVKLSTSGLVETTTDSVPHVATTEQTAVMNVVEELAYLVHRIMEKPDRIKNRLENLAKPLMKDLEAIAGNHLDKLTAVDDELVSTGTNEIEDDEITHSPAGYDDVLKNLELVGEWIEDVSKQQNAEGEDEVQ